VGLRGTAVSDLDPTPDWITFETVHDGGPSQAAVLAFGLVVLAAAVLLALLLG